MTNLNASYNQLAPGQEILVNPFLDRQTHIAIVGSTILNLFIINEIGHDPNLVYAILAICGSANLVFCLGFLGLRFNVALNNETRPLPIIEWTTIPALLLITLPPVRQHPPLDWDQLDPISHYIQPPAPLRGPPVSVR